MLIRTGSSSFHDLEAITLRSRAFRGSSPRKRAYNGAYGARTYPYERHWGHMMGLAKHMNGSLVTNGHVVSFVEELPRQAALKTSMSSTLVRYYSCLAAFVNILRSAIPYLMLLFVYGINGHVHILPRFDDITCVHLYNISAFEDTLLHFQFHKMISSLSHPALDMLAALPYLLHYVIPIWYPIYLIFRGQAHRACQFYWLLGVSMWIHYIVWFFLPTAPPWVYDNIDKYSTDHATAPPFHLQHKEGCAFERLDARTGVPFFFKLFSSNPVPFASFPSGHVGWATCILATGAPGGKLFGAYVAWVAWATLYSCHHYISDAVAAICIVFGTNRLLNYVTEKFAMTRSKNNCACLKYCPVPAVVCSFHMV